MASPAVVGTPAETAISTAGTSHVVNLPSGAAGNLFIAIMDKGSTAATVNSLTGWNELLDENAGNGLYIAWKAVDGTEGATTTFTLSSATRGAWIVYEISGAADPSVTPPAIATTGTGTSTTPNPPSITPPSNKDYLFIAFAGMAGEEADDDTWGNSPPTNYTPATPRQISCGTAGTNLGGLILSAERALATGSAEDPGTFSVDTSAAWRSQTIIVHPKTTTTSVAEVSLDSVNTPDVRTGHSIKLRASKASGSGTVVMKAALYEGANNRSTNLTSSALTTSLADYTLSIAEADAEDITDYSDLGIRFWAESTSGNTIAVTVAEIYLEVPAGTASAAYSLDCQPGSFSVTGTAMTPLAARTINAATGTYTLTGFQAQVGRTLDLNAATGSYAVTGTAMTPLAARTINAATGSYAVTGSAATLSLGLSINAAAGTYAWTGSDATLATGYAFNAAAGSYSVTGSDVTPAATFLFNAAAGTYTVTGFDAGLNVEIPGQYEITAQPGVYAVTGSSATTAATFLFNAAAGSYTVTGFQAQAGRVLEINAAPGSFAVTGVAATFAVTYALVGAPGSFVVTGADAELRLEGQAPNLDEILTGWVALPVQGRMGSGVTGKIRQPVTGGIT